MTITGVLIDATTGKGIPGASIDFYPDGDRTKDPYASITTDANGNYQYTNALLDTETNPIFDAYQTGYNELIAPASTFNGTVKMSESAPGVSGLQSYLVPILIVMGIVFVIWYFKLYK